VLIEVVSDSSAIHCDNKPPLKKQRKVTSKEEFEKLMSHAAEPGREKEMKKEPKKNGGIQVTLYPTGNITFPALPLKSHHLTLMYMCPACLEECNRHLKMTACGKEYIVLVLCPNCVRKNVSLTYVLNSV
jgi:hypothetical protein